MNTHTFNSVAGKEGDASPVAVPKESHDHYFVVRLTGTMNEAQARMLINEAIANHYDDDYEDHRTTELVMKEERAFFAKLLKPLKNQSLGIVPG